MPGGIEVPARPRQLDGLTGIRALAAGWVVIEHFRLVIYILFPGVTVLEPWIRTGFLGVEVFFVLSGFIISYQYADRFSAFSWPQYRKFLELRIARIYPVHLATLLGLTGIILVASTIGIRMSGKDDYTIGSFIGNLLILQGLPGVSPFNNPAWSISVEFAAYLVFPLMALALVGVRSARQGFTTAALVAMVGVAAMMLVAVSLNDSPTGGVMIWLRIATEFTIGCLLFGGWRHLTNKKFGAHWDWAAIASVVVIAVTLGIVGGEGAAALLTVPAIAVFVLSCAGATGVLGRLLATPLMIWGGKVSYSVYMTHFILLMVFGELLPAARFEDSAGVVRLAVLAAYLLGAVAVGAVAYHFVEEPSRKALRRSVAAAKPSVAVRA
jgi:peptidoglycan/LPS O-acetylase OafA/YrhL